MVANKGKGKKGGKVIKANDKPSQTLRAPATKNVKGKGKATVKGTTSIKGKGKSEVEKRRDPSDGNGPFTYQSFIKFHGEELGESLWKQAGQIAGSANETDAKVGNSNANKGPAVKGKDKGKKAGKGEKGSATKDAGKGSVHAANNPFNNKPTTPKQGSNKGKGKYQNFNKGSSKGESKGAKDNKVQKPAGTMKQNNKPEKGAKPEKRWDPEDTKSTRPFSYDSFVKFYGEEKGKQLWETAAVAA